MRALSPRVSRTRIVHRFGHPGLYTALLISLSTGLSNPASAEEAPLPLVRSTIMEVVNQVDILTGEEMKVVSAAPDMLFQYPDFLQTGRRSRARLEAEDGTVTRVGANTLFSFDASDRTINLDRGSLLFHSPTGRGGGRIVTASATASVVGTTIAVSATADGGFKLLVLEGTAKVIYPNGIVRILEAGQMTFVLPSQGGATIRDGDPDGGQTADAGGEPGPVLNFDLKRMEEGSLLLNGFKEPLSSGDKIEAVIRDQQEKIDSGELQDTGARIIEVTDNGEVVLDVSENELTTSTNDLNNTIDSEIIQRLRAAAETEITPQTFDYDEEVNFFPAPGPLVPSSLFDGLRGDERAEGLIAGQINFVDGFFDLAPFLVKTDGDGTEYFFFRALNSVQLSGNVLFSGVLGQAKVEISALEAINLTSGSSISVDIFSPNSFAMSVDNTDFVINEVDITNSAGRIELFTESDLFIQNSIIQAGLGTITSTDPIEGVESITPGFEGTSELLASIFLEGTNIEVSDSQLIAEENNRIGAKDTITVDSSLITGQFIELKADQIDITSTDFTGSDLRIIGNQLLDFSSADLSSMASVNLEARTLILSDIDFGSGSIVSLGSEFGMLAPNPNTNAAAMTGYVNFSNNVFYDGNPAQNFVSTAQGGMASGIAPIDIYAIGSAANE